MYKERASRLEPPYMAPSVDPEDYSRVRVSGVMPIPASDLRIVVRDL